MKYIKDRIFIITGSSKGLGKKFAEEILKRGGHVVINGRDPENLEKARSDLVGKGHDLLAVPGDMTKPADCKRLVEETVRRYGRIDVLINNAGLPMRGRFEQMEPEIMKQVIDINLMSAIYCTGAALPELKKSGGNVIFISSLAGVRGIPNASPYCIAKMGLTALCQSLKIELAGTGIHVGLLRVGLVENRPDKTVFNFDGTYIKVDRKGNQSEMDVTKSLFRMIRQRRFIMTLTGFGKLTRTVQWLAPWVINLYLVRTQFSEKYK